MRAFIEKAREFLSQDFSGLIIALMLAIGILWTVFALISTVAGVFTKIMPEKLAFLISLALFIGLSLVIYGLIKKKKASDSEPEEEEVFEYEFEDGDRDD